MHIYMLLWFDFCYVAFEKEMGFEKNEYEFLKEIGLGLENLGGYVNGKWRASGPLTSTVNPSNNQVSPSSLLIFFFFGFHFFTLLIIIIIIIIIILDFKNTVSIWIWLYKFQLLTIKILGLRSYLRNSKIVA